MKITAIVENQSKHSGFMSEHGLSLLINMIGVAIQKRMSAAELGMLQVATHPYLTSVPTIYPVIMAAQEVSKKM
ncbi:MAG: FAD-dependent pyridine nucleotide-disulfide oxidoreductase [uncultured bacterium]|nr:MAG: FAD-dependent pyridine nucleotide-disulfide oxidoreductase [uncultured bacterium]